MTLLQLLGLFIVVLIIPLGMIAGVLTVKAKSLEKMLRESMSLNRELAQIILLERAGNSTAKRAEAQAFCEENSLEAMLKKIHGRNIRPDSER